MASLRPAAHLRADILAFDAFALAQRQDDRADHRDEQDHAGKLEEIDVVRVQDRPERLGVGHFAAGIGCGALRHALFGSSTRR